MADLALPEPAVIINKFVPTIYPTIEEFKDFAKVITDARAANPNVGAIKIKPPPEWRPRKTRRDYKDIGSIEIPTPIKQIVQPKSGGVYNVINIEQKTITVADYEKLSEEQARVCRISDMDVEKLERKFWISLVYDPATYGADMVRKPSMKQFLFIFF